MTNSLLLNDKIDASGLKRNSIAEKLGVSRVSLYNKVRGVTEFTAVEMYTLSDLLNLTDDEKESIFFNQKVGK